MESHGSRELHPLEVKVLLRYGPDDAVSHARLVADLGYNVGQAHQALSWLAAKEYAVETARAQRVFYEITDFGRECIAKGTYEQRIVDAVEAAGSLTLPEIAQKLGIEAKDVGSAFGGLSKDKVLAMDAGKRAALAPGARELLAKKQASLQALLGRAQTEALDEATLAPEEAELVSSQAKKRGASGSLFRRIEREELTFALTPAGIATGVSLKKAGATGEEAGALTPEMLKTGAWKTAQFRRYNIDVPPTRVLAGRKNPYCDFLGLLKDKLASLGFEEFDGRSSRPSSGTRMPCSCRSSTRRATSTTCTISKSPTHAKQIEQP